MTTSGTYNFNPTGDDLIMQAFARLGKGDVSGSDLRDAQLAANMLLIDLSNRDVMIWKLELLQFSLTGGTQEYTLPTYVDGVIDLVLKDSKSTEVSLQRLSLVDFNRISEKSTQGRPMQYTVKRNIDSIAIKFWQIPSDNQYTASYWAVKRIEDVGSLRNTVDMSYRFIPAFIYGLAYHLAFTRQGIPPQYRQELKQEFEDQLMRARDDYRERVSWKFSPKLNIQR